jgi:pyruvate/2-oxoglutarate dehydrogenase complex dihydrolipoamide dehydrogenase (E3) component
VDIYGKFIPLAEWKVIVDDRLENPGQEPLYNLKPDAREIEYDAIFIGGGASGRFGTAMLTALGGRGLVIDKWPFLGGSCPHEACVPHHVFSEAARELDYAREFGGEFWYREWDPKNASILSIRDMFMTNRNMGHSIMNFQSKEQLGIEFILDAWATVIDKNTVEVNGERFRCKNLVLCTGARPIPPAIPGITMRGVYDWSSMLDELDYEPNRCVVIGGGKTALEYGSFIQATGCATTYLTRSPLMKTKGLQHVDEDIRLYVKRMVEHRGSTVVEGAEPLEILGDGKVEGVRYRDASGAEHTIDCDFVFLGTGETAESHQFDVLGLELDDKRRIVVDKHMRTSVEGVWAAGDLIDGPMEMFKARKAGVCAARNIMGQTDYTFDYSDYPDFMHTTYEVTWTGLSEEEARAQYQNVMVIQMPPKGVDPKDTGLPATDGSMFFAFLRPGLNGIIKSVIDADSRKIVGLHTVGFGNKNSFQYLDYLLKRPEGFTIDQMAEVNELFLNDGFPQLHRLRAGQKNLTDL